eukprot:2493276-Rhodomonas_salina.5
MRLVRRFWRWSERAARSGRVICVQVTRSSLRRHGIFMPARKPADTEACLDQHVTRLNLTSRDPGHDPRLHVALGTARQWTILVSGMDDSDSN